MKKAYIKNVYINFIVVVGAALFFRYVVGLDPNDTGLVLLLVCFFILYEDIDTMRDEMQAVSQQIETLDAKIEDSKIYRQALRS